MFGKSMRTVLLVTLVASALLNALPAASAEAQLSAADWSRGRNSKLAVKGVAGVSKEALRFTERLSGREPSAGIFLTAGRIFHDASNRELSARRGPPLGLPPIIPTPLCAQSVSMSQRCSLGSVSSSSARTVGSGCWCSDVEVMARASFGPRRDGWS